jgi:hypothetical protein
MSFDACDVAAFTGHRQVRLENNKAAWSMRERSSVADSRAGAAERDSRLTLVQTPGMSVAHRRYTIQEFIALERYSNVRHEFLRGQIYAMAGETPEHGLFAANMIGILTAALRGRPCRVHTSDGRIRVPKTGLDTYPDVSVVCGHAELDEEDGNALTNPGR